MPDVVRPIARRFPGLVGRAARRPAPPTNPSSVPSSVLSPLLSLLVLLAFAAPPVELVRLRAADEPARPPVGATAAPREAWEVERRVAADEAFQAAAADAKSYYAIGSTSIGKYDRETGRRTAVSSGDALHLNSGFLYEGRLLCAHSNYPGMPESSQIKALDLQTMRLTTWHDFGDYGGSLTWVVRHDDAWWCNFARYGDVNAETFLARFDERWQETGRWTYPPEVLRRLGKYSLSGGVWRNGSLLVTGHDERELYRLRLPAAGRTLDYVETIPVPFTGQGIAVDPTSDSLLGIDRAKRQIVIAKQVGANTSPSTPPNGRPNIVFLLADDLGYGDLGCFGQQKIRTPRLDRLAAEGMRLTRHYSGAPVCAPSRCVLMTGLHAGHAAVRNNRETKPEGQHPLPADTVALPKLLTAAGYATGGFGKWGLGPPDSTGSPLRQGLQRFFGYNCQRAAHNFYPTYLWDDDRRLPLDNPDFSPHQRLPVDADAADPAVYARYAGRQYAPDLITDAALQFVRDHRDRPFFLYYPTSVPHLALQVPDDSLQEYAGKFPEQPYRGDRGYLPHPTPRAAYAAMITRLDREIGRLVDLVEELGLSERTIFVFSSDNGPLYDRLGGTDADFFNSAGGLRGRKGSVYEGGVRVPTIVRWKGSIRAGGESNRTTGFEDWLPTLLELAGAADRIPADRDGVSFAPTLRGETQPPRELLYREFPGYGGQQSIQVGEWKAVRQNLLPAGKQSRPAGAGKIELYDLQKDPTESHDVADANPELVAKLADLMRREHRPSKEFPFPPLDREVAAAPGASP